MYNIMQCTAYADTLSYLRIIIHLCGIAIVNVREFLKCK